MENLVNLGEESLTQGLVFKLPWVTCEAASLRHVKYMYCWSNADSSIINDKNLKAVN